MIAGEYAEKRMPPSDDVAFKKRINRRVQWLRLKDWWEHFRFWPLLRQLLRPAMLLFVGLGPPLLIYWKLDWFFPELNEILPGGMDGTGKDKLVLQTEIEWRAIAQPALVLIGIPAAFILWAFRDINANKDLENKRKDVNLKEFQEIQMRAAGAMDEKLPESARESLQVAATHQLAGFLKGEYGASFRRPAWELLRARLLASSQRMGYQSISTQIDDWRKADPENRLSPKELGRQAKTAARSITMDSTGKAQRDVVHDEWRTIFGGRLPLPGTVFDGIELPSYALLASRDLSRSSFIGANLTYAHLEHANLRYAHLEGTYLWGAHLEGAYLTYTHLEGASLGRAKLRGADLSYAQLEGAYLGRTQLEGAMLMYAHLEGAILMYAHLEGAYLWSAHLEGTHLGGAHLEGANLTDAHLDGADLEDAHLEGADLEHAHLDENTKLKNATFDDQTKFAYNWDTLSDEEKSEARIPWIERGMVHIDTLDTEENESVDPLEDRLVAPKPEIDPGSSPR